MTSRKRPSIDYAVKTSGSPQVKLILFAIALICATLVWRLLDQSSDSLDAAEDRLTKGRAGQNEAAAKIRDLERERDRLNQQVLSLTTEVQKLRQELAQISRGTGGAVASVSPSEKPLSVLEVQRILRKRGYLVGPIDGVMGNKTREALQKFQIKNGLPASGSIDEATSAKLTEG